MLVILHLILSLVWAGCGVASCQHIMPKSKKSVVPASGNTGVTVPRDVEVQSKNEAAHADAIQLLGRAIVEAHGVVAEKYLSLCLYVRKHSVSGKLLTFELSKLGIIKQRITEVRRVCDLPDKEWSDFAARSIGFKKAVEIARALKPGEAQVTPAGQLLITAGSLTPKDSEQAVAAENTPVESTGKAKVVSIKDVAKKLCSMATRDKHVFCFKDYPYTCVLTRQGKTGPALGDTENEKD